MYSLCLGELHPLAVFLPRARVLRLSAALRHDADLRPDLPQVRVPDDEEATARQVQGNHRYTNIALYLYESIKLVL